VETLNQAIFTSQQELDITWAFDFHQEPEYRKRVEIKQKKKLYKTKSNIAKVVEDLDITQKNEKNKDKIKADIERREAKEKQAIADMNSIEEYDIK
jgi:metal-dependent amidase/aminoacylase/carboxypeptidase family protein